MTENQKEIYLLLLMAGQAEEAKLYQEKCNLREPLSEKTND